MISLLLPLLAATLSSVQAIPYPKRGLAEVISQCHHDFAYTWDDGPYTAHNDIRAAFNNVGGKTTFFANGDNWSCIYDQNNVDALRGSFEAGHQIASHTWSHAHLSQLTEAQIDVEIQRLDEAFVKILGVRPKYLRPPYGDIDERTASYIQSKHGKTIVLWSADSGDSTGGSAQDSYDFYANFARAGPAGGPQMTLSHETEPAGTAAMYNGTVPLLANAGIHLVTVAQCLDTDAYEYVGNYGTRDSTWYCGGTWTPSNPTSTSTTISSTSSTSSTTSSTPAPTCVSTYSSQPNDTCASIEANFGLPAGSILAANSFLNCNDIWQYTPICIPPGGTGSTTRPTSTSTSTSTTRTTSTSSTTSSTPVPTCVTTYVSRPNDTCATIESQFHLSTGAISAANSFVNCNDIWSGTPLCIPPGGIGASCTSTISSSPGDTCDRIGGRYGISGYQVQLWNSFLNCNDIWTYTPVCVSHS